MNFLRPETLFFIWVIPVLFLVVVYGTKKRRKILQAFSTPRGLKAIAPEEAVQRRWIKALLVLGAMLCMVFAMAGPRYGYSWREIERKGIDIVIALDCSKSMLATDIQPTRLDRAKREIVDLLNLLKGDRVGLVAFAGTAFLQCPLTLDYEAFYLFLNALTPDFLPVGGTDIAGAVDAGISGFSTEDHTDKAIILITDGESTGGDPLQAAERAKAAGVKLFCIGVGKDEGAPIPEPGGGFKKDRTGNIVISRLDEDTLKKAAVATGGSYVRSVAGDMDLDAVYNREIRGKMDASTLSSGRKQIWEDRYQWFLLPALLLLLLELFLAETRKTMFLVLFGLALIFNHSAALAAGVYQSMQTGREAYNSGEYQKALKHFIDAQLEDPDRAGIYYDIGNTYYKMGDYASAYENYTQALKSESKALKQKSLYNRGNTSYRLGRFEDAISDYQAALELDPQDLQAAENMEFVKKKLEMQNKPKPGGADGKNGQGDQKSQDQNAEKAQEDRKDEDGESKADPAKKEDLDGENRASQRSGAPEPLPPSKELEAADARQRGNDGGQQAPGESEHDPNRMKQAERILNRLKDLPGKAMMPAYGPGTVERDW